MTREPKSTFIPISKPFVGDAEKAAVLEVLDSGMLVQGARVEALEKAFAKASGVDHAVATSSGTTALYLALLAHGIGPGDEVITTPFTFVASVNSILYTGARPVFADIDPATFNIDPDAVTTVLTERTRAIMPVHLYGQPCDMDALGDIARRHSLALIEDAAQAVGATYRDRQVGSFGTGVFSLYATKNVMAGEGGMITTGDPALADRLRLLRSHGMRRRYEYECLGYNFRLSELHAAIGVAQMGRLLEMTAARQRNAAFLNANLEGVVTPTIARDRTHVWHQYTIRLSSSSDREAMRLGLEEAGIGSAIFYPTPVHRFDHVMAATITPSLPVSEQIANQVLSLPVHPSLTPEDLDRIVFEVNRLI
jgi:perosamine synthetase